MERPRLNRLTAEIVNQIAAGEVIERPASVVKELVDNSIDAKAQKIIVKVKSGGMEYIEVSDDGIGIPKENLEEVFDAHTTSKISNMEDLNNLMSMGFRGEALSTITSVAKVTVVSKFEGDDIAYEISYDENGKGQIKKSPREKGTTVKVSDLFYNIPARRKYLKSEQTEYRKIYELLMRYFLVFPNIHFVLEKDGKIVEDFKEIEDSKAGDILIQRAADIFKSDDSLKLFYNGSGIEIKGISAHPSTHQSKNAKQYIFINSRPVTDHGIVRAVYEGYSRFLPFGEKVSFIINLNIKPELVDVNVHPRKEEVRFENPYRVYSAVTEAVRHTLEEALSFRSIPEKNDMQRDFNFQQSRNSYSQPSTESYISREIKFDKKSKSVKDSLLFSKEILSSNQYTQDEPVNHNGDVISISQIFDKYIVVEFENENVWIIDQHAAAERINYEKISSRELKNINVQTLLVPQEIMMNTEEKLFLDENRKFFEELGFRYKVVDKGISISALPMELGSNSEIMFKEIFELAENPEVLKKNFEKMKNDILATIACHSSVRSGQKLQKEEMLSIYNQLAECTNPYSCPHGRPAVWRLSLGEIDKHFERTY